MHDLDCTIFTFFTNLPIFEWSLEVASTITQKVHDKMDSFYWLVWCVTYPWPWLCSICHQHTCAVQLYKYRQWWINWKFPTAAHTTLKWKFQQVLGVRDTLQTEIWWPCFLLSILISKNPLMLFFCHYRLMQHSHLRGKKEI